MKRKHHLRSRRLNRCAAARAPDMRISTKAQYAVRAMVSLSLHGAGRPLALRDIAGREEISLAYLEQLFVKLRRGKIVGSVRGPGGGYVLARPAEQIRVDEIIDS